VLVCVHEDDASRRGTTSFAKSALAHWTLDRLISPGCDGPARPVLLQALKLMLTNRRASNHSGWFFRRLTGDSRINAYAVNPSG
jgi:hypothetical protein